MKGENKMTNNERLEALLMAGAVQFLTKGALNCTKLAEYLAEHGVVVSKFEKKAKWQRAPKLTSEEAIQNLGAIVQRRKNQ